MHKAIRQIRSRENSSRARTREREKQSRSQHVWRTLSNVETSGNLHLQLTKCTIMIANTSHTAEERTRNAKRCDCFMNMPLIARKANTFDVSLSRVGALTRTLARPVNALVLPLRESSNHENPCLRCLPLRLGCNLMLVICVFK